MGTEHNNINANDRYKGYTSFHDNADIWGKGEPLVPRVPVSDRRSL